jgi:succinyl-CoA synthetase alpha subunit
VYGSVADAVKETGATASFISVPPRGAADAIIEAAEAGIAFIVCITEGIPAQDEALAYNRLVRSSPVPGSWARTARGSSPPGSATSGSPRATSPWPVDRWASSAVRAR